MNFPSGMQAFSFDTIFNGRKVKAFCVAFDPSTGRFDFKPVVSKPQRDALTVEGRVKLAKKDAETQTVTIRWLVKTPDGKLLGDVKQSNDVPVGALDGGWGPAARAVAEAAATGIFDVVKTYR